MEAKSEIRDFLRSRRARLTPEQAGLRTFGGGTRQVPGLRREEVALLAGVSVDYYTRLERAHLFDLARAAGRPTQGRRRCAAERIRPTVQRLLVAITGVPALVRNGRGDLLAANRLGRALYSQQFDSPFQPIVAMLHAEAGRDPYDRGLSDLVGELSTRSERFRTLWAAHDVHRHDTGVKGCFHHPIVGDLTVTYESLEPAADPGLTMFVYTAEPGSRSTEALGLLASWAATPDEETRDGDHEEQPRHHSRAE